MALTNSHAQVHAYDFDSGVFGFDSMDAAGIWQNALTEPLPTPLAYTYFQRQADHALSGSPVGLCASWLDAPFSPPTTSARTSTHM